jgi:recombination protein RecA
MSENEQVPALQEIKDRLNKLYGKGTLICASEKPERVPVISAGSLLVDIATGIGGFPQGRIVEIIAPESAGKTTLSLQTVASAQHIGKEVVYVDMEHSLDMSYARKLGVDTSKLMISQPRHGEEALNIVKNLTETGKVGLIIVDSVAALVPKKELEGEVGDSNIGRQAWMMSQALRILTPMAESKGTLIIFTNQIRIKVGVMYGSPETGSGGEALKFYASMRLDMRRTVDKENEGNKVRIRVIKNKLAVPYKEANVFIQWGKGIDRVAEVLTLATDSGIVSKAGSWYSYEGTRLGQGEEYVRGVLVDNPELFTRIESQVLQRWEIAS